MKQLAQSEGIISIASPASNADDLNRLVELSLESGVISAQRQDCRLSIYPMSIAEPDPVLAVNSARGLQLLGSALKLSAYEFTDPIAFTVHILEDVVTEANALLGRLEAIAA